MTRARRWPIYAGFALLAVVALAVIPSVRLPPPAEPAGPWLDAFTQKPRGDDCEVLREIARARVAGGAPLAVSDVGNARLCRWIAEGRMVRPVSGEASRCRPGAPCGHVTLGRPSYSLFGRKARAELGFHGGPLVGNGEICTVVRRGKKWAFRGCKDSWIA